MKFDQQEWEKFYEAHSEEGESVLDVEATHDDNCEGAEQDGDITNQLAVFDISTPAVVAGPGGILLRRAGMSILSL